MNKICNLITFLQKNLTYEVPNNLYINTVLMLQ